MKIIPIPTGTRDILPAEAEELRCLEVVIRQVFKRFGYGEVMTPTLETEAALEASGERSLRKSFRLFDEQGDVLVMRPEMTVPIARLAATRMADRNTPLRLCYFANSFRPTKPQRGRQSEFYQAGLELIGLDEPAVDAEVLAVLCQALSSCGLTRFSLGLGEVSFFRALLDSAGIDSEARDAIFDALMAKDVVGLADVVASLDISGDDREAIMEVTALRGGSEVLTRAQELVRGPQMEDALKRLARTFYLVSRHGFADRILFDFGIFRNFAYYTGVVFEVLSEDIGFPIGGGGRYDALLARFGRPEPAVGFAIGLDRLHIAATSQRGMSLVDSNGVVLVGGLDESLELATAIRETGVPVAAIPAAEDEARAVRLAGENDFRYVLLPAGEDVRLVDVGAGGSRKLARDDLMKTLAPR